EAAEHENISLLQQGEYIPFRYCAGRMHHVFKLKLTDPCFNRFPKWSPAGDGVSEAQALAAEPGQRLQEVFVPFPRVQSSNADDIQRQALRLLRSGRGNGTKSVDIDAHGNQMSSGCRRATRQLVEKRSRYCNRERSALKLAVMVR